MEDAKETRFGAAELRESGEVTGKLLDFTLLHGVSGVAAKRVLLAGAGKPDKFDPAEMRKLVAAAVRFLKPKGIKRIAIALEGASAGPEFAAAAVEGAILGDYEPDRYKGGEKKALESVAIVGGDEAAVKRGQILAESQNFARALANEPANLLTPLKMAEAARAMCAESGLKCEVLERGEMEKLGMGALLGVAQGSAEPPALIVIRYKPAAREIEGPPRPGGKGRDVRYRRNLD